MQLFKEIEDFSKEWASNFRKNVLNLIKQIIYVNVFFYIHVIVCCFHQQIASCKQHHNTRYIYTASGTTWKISQHSPTDHCDGENITLTQHKCSGEKSVDFSDYLFQNLFWLNRDNVFWKGLCKLFRNESPWKGTLQEPKHCKLFLS